MIGRPLKQCGTIANRAVQMRASSTGFNFEFTPDQLELRNTVRKFVAEEVIPKAAEYDKTMEYPWDIIKKSHALGLLNSEIPTAYGGLELDVISSTIIHEEFAYGCSGIGTAVTANGLAETPLVIAANDDIKKRFLGRMIDEPLVASYAVTEPGAGSDVAGAKTKAVKKGDEYIINGSKMWITNAGHANWFFVLCRTAEDPKTPAGKAFTAFAVEGDSLELREEERKSTWGNDAQTHVDVRVPVANVVGAPGEGFKIAMKTFDKTRPTVAALATGVIARCLDEAARYSLERKTFGTQICNHQAIQFLLAEIAMDLELSRLMTYKSAYEADQGRPGSYYASLAKLYSSQAANKAASNAVQIFGGAGFNTEYPVEKLMRDAKIFEIYEGTSQIQKMVIARQLLGRVKETGSY